MMNFAGAMNLHFYSEDSLQEMLERRLGRLPHGAAAAFAMAVLATVTAAGGHKLTRPARPPAIVRIAEEDSNPRL